MKEEILKIAQDFFERTFTNEDSSPKQIEVAWNMTRGFPDKLISLSKNKEILFEFVKRTFHNENATHQELEVARCAAEELIFIERLNQ